jgi:hypothetical protein
MSNRSAQSGKFVNTQKAVELPNETVNQARQETKNVRRLLAKRRPTAAEKLILRMLRELESHPKYEGLGAQQILDAVNLTK